MVGPNETVVATAMKQAGGNTAAGIAAFAASTGVSHATAQRVVYAVTGK
jgi:hypothetical protein